MKDMKRANILIDHDKMYAAARKRKMVKIINEATKETFQKPQAYLKKESNG